MTLVVCSIRCGMMCCAYDFTSKDPLPERPAKRACAGIAPKDPLQERPVKPVPFGVRRNFSDRTVLVDATPWHVSVDGRNEELSRCVWENEFLRGRGTLRSREIRVCMFYAGQILQDLTWRICPSICLTGQGEPWISDSKLFAQWRSGRRLAK